MLPRSLLPAILLLLTASPAAAQTPTCDALDGARRALAQEILQSEHPYDCCDDTIAACLAREKVCRLAHRLAENVCRRVSAGEAKKKIARALSRRAQTMLPGKKAQIDLSTAPPAGSAEAPVEVVVYACARCPFCSKILPKLYSAFTSGALKGKARLHLRVFPIRGHEGSKEGGLALLAASRMGKSWPLLLEIYERFDAFRVDTLPAWASEAGLDKAEYERLYKDKETVSGLVASKKEGIRNKVSATPTFFLDGRRFMGEATAEEIVDLAEELYERKKGLTHR
jgi:protein-disulfide isomerase